MKMLLLVETNDEYQGKNPIHCDYPSEVEELYDRIKQNGLHGAPVKLMVFDDKDWGKIEEMNLIKPQ